MPSGAPLHQRRAHPSRPLRLLHTSDVHLESDTFGHGEQGRRLRDSIRTAFSQVISTANGLQADLNAAANIGLKALMDPDWPGKWWFVPCDRSTGKPSAEKTKGSALFADCKALLTEPEASRDEDNTSAKAGKKQRPIVNLWRDLTDSAVGSSSWADTKKYWNDVERQVITALSAR